MKKRISWKKDIREAILEALEQNPVERFPTIRSVWYYLWSALQMIPGTEKAYQQVDSLLVALRKEGVVPFGRFKVKRGETGDGGEIALEETGILEHHFGGITELPDTYELPQQYGQPHLIEVWVEKAGLLPTFETLCDEYDIRVRSPEGFSPWEFCNFAVQDFKRFYTQRRTENVKILYFGDQDPSGEQICENIKEQLDFFGVKHDTQRLGVTIDQIGMYGLPETPLDAKTLEKIRNDSRYPKYIGRHGREIFCELDAFVSLAYDDLCSVVKTAIEPLINEKATAERKERNIEVKENLKKAIGPDIERLNKLQADIIKRYKELE